MGQGSDLCYLCGTAPGVTKDHVPPKCLFASPLPANLITLPCCEECNLDYSKDEEYFRVFVLGGSYDHPEAKRIWDSKVRRALARKPRFRVKLAQGVVPVQVITRAGLHLGQAMAISADTTRINRVLHKIVKGLYYHHHSRRLDSVCLETFFNPSDPQIHLWKEVPRFDVGRGVFSYWHGIGKDIPGLSMWWLVFYERVLFIVTTVPLKLVDKLPQERV